MAVSCAPGEELRVFFLDIGLRVSTGFIVTFLDGQETEVRSHSWSITGSESGPSFVSSNTAVHHMGDYSQGIIDGMLLDNVLEMTVRAFPGDRNVRESARRRVDHTYEFKTESFPVVHEFLTDYCYLTPDEVQATIVAEALTAPTRTPIPPPTLTPTPQVTWQQEWCKEQGNPDSSIDGFWHPSSGVHGTARLIVRCAGGLLVVGVHITQSDGAYPENESGVAIAVQDDGAITPYRHYESGLQQVRGSGREGLFIILPDEAARNVVKIAYGTQFRESRMLGLWVRFDADSNRRSNADVVIPLRGLKYSDVPSVATPPATPHATSTQSRWE